MQTILLDSASARFSISLWSPESFSYLKSQPSTNSFPLKMKSAREPYSSLPSVYFMRSWSYSHEAVIITYFVKILLEKNKSVIRIVTGFSICSLRNLTPSSDGSTCLFIYIRPLLSNYFSQQYVLLLLFTTNVLRSVVYDLFWSDNTVGTFFTLLLLAWNDPMNIGKGNKSKQTYLESKSTELELQNGVCFENILDIQTAIDAYIKTFHNYFHCKDDLFHIF